MQRGYTDLPFRVSLVYNYQERWCRILSESGDDIFHQPWLYGKDHYISFL